MKKNTSWFDYKDTFLKTSTSMEANEKVLLFCLSNKRTKLLLLGFSCFLRHCCLFLFAASSFDVRPNMYSSCLPLLSVCFVFAVCRLSTSLQISAIGHSLITFLSLLLHALGWLCAPAMIIICSSIRWIFIGVFATKTIREDSTYQTGKRIVWV